MIEQLSIAQSYFMDPGEEHSGSVRKLPSVLSTHTGRGLVFAAFTESSMSKSRVYL